MCLRMRRLGWQIWRIDAGMTLHDANMSRFGQFWNRMRRSGYAWAEGAAMYGRGPERYGVAGVRRALMWGLVLPLVILAGLVLIGSAGFWLLLAYPAQVIRLALRGGGSRGAWEQALFGTLGKFAETAGVVEYLMRRWRGQTARIIEYK